MATHTPASPADFIDAILQGDDKTADVLAPVHELLRVWESTNDTESLVAASNKFWIASRDGTALPETLHLRTR